MKEIKTFVSDNDHVTYDGKNIIIDSEGFDFGEDCGSGFERLARFESNKKLCKIYFREKYGSIEVIIDDEKTDEFDDMIKYINTKRDRILKEGVDLENNEKIEIRFNDSSLERMRTNTTRNTFWQKT